ncbi:hypothetical protein BSTP3_081 [Bacillus phage BSTP3]|nr:hypothetical protein BSTP3_081 [Bacillus phage BSTP3]
MSEYRSSFSDCPVRRFNNNRVYLTLNRLKRLKTHLNSKYFSIISVDITYRLCYTIVTVRYTIHTIRR